MNCIYPAAYGDNEASLASNENVGFKREGIIHQPMYKDERFYDLVELEILRSESDESHGGTAQ